MKKTNTYKKMVLLFLLGIIISTLILKIPFLLEEGATISWFEALFTASSAITTTGLNIINVSETFNVLGYFILIIMFNVGAVSIIAIYMTFWSILKRNIGYSASNMIKLELNQTKKSNILNLLLYILKTLLAIEIIATILIIPFVYENFNSLWEAFYQSLFYVTSALSSSGFVIYDTTFFYDIPFVFFISLILMMIGGLGFPIMVEVKDYIKAKINNKKNFYWSYYTKIIIKVSIFMYIISFILIMISERNTTYFMTMTPWEKIYNGLYLTFSAKSIGLTQFTDLSILSSETLLLLVIIMFIGGAPSSTTGGVRLTTIYLIYLHFKSLIKGSENVTYDHIHSNDKSILKAYLIVFSFIILIFISSFIMYQIDPTYTVFQYIFEATSGITTTGFSLGVSEGTIMINQFILIILMLIGRIGIINLIYSFYMRRGQQDKRIKYIEKEIII